MHQEEKVWAGVDIGKGFHWVHVVAASGEALLSRRVENDEADLHRLIDEVLSLAEDVTWAVDQPAGAAVLLLALLWERNHKVLYVPGITVDRARDAYPGESKTDARDAHVIADQARMRSDFVRLSPAEGDLAELQLLLARRRDLVADRTRAITRLRETLLAFLPSSGTGTGLQQDRRPHAGGSLPNSFKDQAHWPQAPGCIPQEPSPQRC